MSMMVSFVLSFFPRDVLDEILNLIESVSEDFSSYSFTILSNCQYFVVFTISLTYNSDVLGLSLSFQINVISASVYA